MKKIISINLSGRVIPIEDSAYEMLQSYIESLRRYFANEDGRDEIINDIESRIAELMNEKVRLGASAITDADVNEIIQSMGRPEDFDAAEAETASTSQSSTSQQSSQKTEYEYSTHSRSRLYRDSSDKMIGGVCAGLANYINIDPAIIRLLFAIITFGGFGAGIIIYILLWMILPVRDLEQYEGKRLYRNYEDRVLGGVASGMAAYFGREPWLIRLLFSAPILLNILFGIISWPFFHEGSFVPNIVFGSLSSTFILAYIILWIVLPEAKSPYQKMEMRGEKVDVNSIRQNVKDEMESGKSRYKQFAEEVKETADRFSARAKEFAGSRGKEFASEAGNAVKRTSRGILGIFGVIFKIFFLFIAGTIAFGLFVALMGLIFGGIGIWPLKNFILDGFWQNTFAWGTLILFLGVPLIGFIIWLLRRIMSVRSTSNYLGWTFGGLWTLGWICVALLAASITNEFRMSNDRSDATEMSITQPAKGKMIVRVSEPEIEYSGTLPWITLDGEGMDITRDTLKLSNVRIRIEQSKDSFYHVELKKYSRGKSLPDAEAKAAQMVFHSSYYSDSILDIGSGFAIAKESKFRAQQIIMVIKVPTGKKIRFDESIDKLHDFNIRVGGKQRWMRRSHRFDIDMDEYFDYRSNTDYTMGADGDLKGPDGAPVNNSYQYKPDTTSNSVTPSDIQRQIELEKQKKEESEKKIRDLENQQNQQKQAKPTTDANPDSEKDKAEGSVAGNPTPVFNIVNWLN